MKLRMSLIGLVFALSAQPALADRPPTIEELAHIETALRAHGFQAWDEIELDDDGWEIDDAVAADGRRYDLKLDPVTLAILESEVD